jgi:hypothetical protein
MSTLIIGSSHLFAMMGSGAPQADAVAFKLLQDFPHQHRIAERTELGVHLFPDVEQFFSENPHFQKIAVMISGSDWLKLCLTAWAPPMDFILPGDSALPLDETARIVPVAEIKAAMRTKIDHVLDGIEALGQRTWRPGVQLYFLEGPPAVLDNDFMTASLTASQDPWLRQYADKPMTPSHLRLKMARLHNGLINAACDAAGLIFVPAPASVKDDEGFLRADCHHDVMHGNFVYGTRMIQHVEATLGPLN